MKRLLLFACLLLLAPAQAWSEACTFYSSGNWSSATTYTGGVSGCTLSADDTVTIVATATATITGSVTQSGTASITVAGTLTMPVSTSQLTLTVGTGGLTCQAGSTCQFDGSYRSLGTSPAWVSEPSTDVYWQFGDFTRLTADIVESRWPSGTYDRATGTAIGTGIQTSIASWLNGGSLTGGVAAGDIVAFWNPSGIATAASPDSYAAYIITGATSTASPYRIGFRAAVSSAPKPVPQAMQEIPTGTIGSAITLATRTAILGTGLISSGQEYYFVGRWLRLEKPTADGTYEPYGYRILSVTDDAGGDIVKIADTRGFSDYYPSGSDYAIDYGWRTGDPMMIYRPANVVCVTAGECPFVVSGTFYAKAARFALFNAIEFTGAPTVSRFQDVYLDRLNQKVGGSYDAGYNFKLEEVSGNISVSRVFSAGGDVIGENGAGGTTQHGVTMLTSTSSYTPSFTGTDVTFRYHGDDCIVSEAQGTSSITMNRFRCQWIADEGASAQFIDLSTASTATRVTVTDGECLDCTTDGNSSSDFVQLTTTASVTTDGVLNLGQRGTGSTSIYEQGWTNTDYMQLGMNTSASTTGEVMFPPVADRFVFRENTMSGTNAVYFNDDIGREGMTWKNGLIASNIQTGTPPAYGIQMYSASAKPVSTVQNVAFVDNENSTASSILFTLSNVKDGSVFENITMTQRPGAVLGNMFARFMYFNDATPVYTSRYNLVTGNKRSTFIALLSPGSGSGWVQDTLTKTGWCLFNNTLDVSGITYTQYASSTAYMADRPVNFLDPAQRKFAASSGSLPASYGCGANTRAGITDYMWMHAISGLQPESLGTLGGGGASGWIPKSH